MSSLSQKCLIPGTLDLNMVLGDYLRNSRGTLSDWLNGAVGDGSLIDLINEIIFASGLVMLLW